MIAISELQDVLYKIYLRSPNNLFDEFVAECQKWYNSPAHTLTEMKTRDNKKIRGDIFEAFSILYLKYVKCYKNVWLLKDLPIETLEKLNMKRQDMGIDIIVETEGGDFIAVQCKYKTPTGFKQNVLSWKTLSTFYALCLRTGPWSKFIVITNCIYTRHQGKKTPQDIYYCLHLCTFKTPILLIHFLGIFTGFVLWDIFIFPIISTFYDVLIIPYWDAFYCMCYIFF